jgi:enterochelin esterase family protein
MRLLAAGCLLLACGVSGGRAQSPAAAAPPPPLRSPQIGADRRVTFRLRAPAAAEVTLSGEFLRGSQPLRKGDDGIWTITVGPLDPEIYNYNFTIDGVRTIDPNNAEVKTGSTPGTISSILEVPGDGPAFYDAQPVPHGEIRTHWYASKSLNAVRRLTVYTPPDYDRDGRSRYSVLYLFHGANADETAWTRLGHVNLILDNLLAGGRIKPFIVAMPFGYGAPPASSMSGSNTALFGRDLLGDVIPFIDAHYRTYSDRDHRAIAGLSMGGGESLEIGLNHLELFSYVGGFSAAVRPPAFERDFAGLLADPPAANRKLHLLWIGCGAEDTLFPAAQGFSKFLDAAGIKHTFQQSSGAHTWMVWRRYLRDFAPLLFQSPEATTPPQGAAEKPLAPVRIILVGDSTVALKNGWGPGFCAIATPPVTCLDMAKNGRSSSSYRAEGSWKNVLDELQRNAAFRATYVLIQFGHNDQPGKPGRSTDLATEFPVNMRRYVNDVLAAGAKPVLVTPLTRRIFRNGTLENDLAPWAEATKKVAAEAGVPVLDLNSDSAAAVQKMGPVEANTLAMAPPPQAIQETAASGTSRPAPKAPAAQNNNLVEPKGDPAPLFDYTHLGEKGSALFGRMVARELIQAVPALRPYMERPI